MESLSIEIDNLNKEFAATPNQLAVFTKFPAIKKIGIPDTNFELPPSGDKVLDRDRPVDGHDVFLPTGIDPRWQIHTAMHGLTVESETIGRIWIPSSYPVFYSSCAPWKTFKYALHSGVAPLTATFIDKNTIGAIAVLQHLFPTSTEHIVVSPKTCKMLTNSVGMEVEMSRFLYRMAAFLLVHQYAQHAKISFMVNDVDNKNVRFIKSANEYTALLANTLAGTTNWAPYRMEESDLSGEITLKMMAVLTSSAPRFTSNAPIPSCLTSWPPIANLTGLLIGVPSVSLVTAEFTVGEIWSFISSFCGQHGTLDQFISLYNGIAALMFSPTKDVCPLFNSENLIIRLPDAQMQGCIIAPLSTSAETWTLEPVYPDVPSYKHAVWNGVLSSMALGCSAMHIFHYSIMPIINDELRDKMIPTLKIMLQGTREVIRIWSMASKILKSLGLSGSMPRLLSNCTTDSNTASLNKILSHENALQWEELFPWIDNVPDYSVLMTKIIPATPKTTTLTTGIWYSPSQVMGSSSAREAMATLSIWGTGIHFAIKKYVPAVSAFNFRAFTITRSYREAPSDYSFAIPTVVEDNIYSMVFKFPNADSAKVITSLALSTKHMTFAISGPFATQLEVPGEMMELPSGTPEMLQFDIPDIDISPEPSPTIEDLEDKKGSKAEVPDQPVVDKLSLPMTPVKDTLIASLGTSTFKDMATTINEIVAKAGTQGFDHVQRAQALFNKYKMSWTETRNIIADLRSVPVDKRQAAMDMAKSSLSAAANIIPVNNRPLASLLELTKTMTIVSAAINVDPRVSLTEFKEEAYIPILQRAGPEIKNKISDDIVANLMRGICASETLRGYSMKYSAKRVSEKSKISFTQAEVDSELKKILDMVPFKPEETIYTLDKQSNELTSLWKSGRLSSSEYKKLTDHISEKRQAYMEKQRLEEEAEQQEALKRNPRKVKITKVDLLRKYSSKPQNIENDFIKLGVEKIKGGVLDARLAAFRSGLPSYAIPQEWWDAEKEMWAEAKATNDTELMLDRFSKLHTAACGYPLHDREWDPAIANGVPMHYEHPMVKNAMAPRAAQFRTELSTFSKDTALIVEPHTADTRADTVIEEMVDESGEPVSSVLSAIEKRLKQQGIATPKESDFSNVSSSTMESTVVQPSKSEIPPVSQKQSQTSGLPTSTTPIVEVPFDRDLKPAATK
jgi:hypothetical protein